MITQNLAAGTLLLVAVVTALYVCSEDGAPTKYSALGFGAFSAWCAWLAASLLT